MGSYFTLEKWLTPSLFQDVQGESEYDVCKQLGEHKARERLEKHWSTFIDNGDWQVSLARYSLWIDIADRCDRITASGCVTMASTLSVFPSRTTTSVLATPTKKYST